MIAAMPHKTKKTKKKENGKRKQCNDASNSRQEKGKNGGRGLESLAAYLSSDELQQLKTISKNKDLNNMPLIIAGVILNKIDLLKKLLQKGYNIHETGPNRSTALMWAIKYKNLPMIDFLLSNGADATCKTENGDNVLFLALENKIWTEESFLSFWNSVTSITFVDVDFVNKNGRNMLHSAVKKEWTQVVEVLIGAKININFGNLNGITPLMLASYHNNIEIVNALLEANADILKEDVNGNTALCYAISHAITKNRPTPHLVVDKLIIAFRNHKITFKDFLKDRIYLLLNDSVVHNKSKETLSDSKVPMVSYALRYIEGAMKMILELNIFGKIAQATSKNISEPYYMKKYLTIINEVFKYCERYFGTGTNERLLLESFVNDGGADACFLILKTYGIDESYYDYDFVSQALGPIIAVCASETACGGWLHTNYKELTPFYEKYVIINPVQQSDDIQTKRNNEKIVKFKTLIDNIKLDRSPNDNAKSSDERNKLDESDKTDQKATVKESKSNAKKTKRRAKALKAKIAKIKSADLTERLNQNGKRMLEQKCASDSSIIQKGNENDAEASKSQTADEGTKQWCQNSAWEQVWLMDDRKKPPLDYFNKVISVLENNIPTSHGELFDMNIQPKLNCENQSRSTCEVLSLYPDWKDKTQLQQFNDLLIDNKNTCTKFSQTDESRPNGSEITDTSNYVVYYLSGLLKKIIAAYQNCWDQDRQRQNESQEYFARDDAGTSFVCNEYEQVNCSQSQEIIEKMKREHLEALQRAFDSLIVSVKNSVSTNFSEITKIIDKLESVLLNHKVRGKSLLPESLVQAMTINENVLNDSFGNLEQNDLDVSLPKCLGNTLNINNSTDHFEIININKEQNDSQQNPDSLYLREIIAMPPQKIPNSHKIRNSKIRTMGEAYHLIPSIIAMCDDDDDDAIFKKQKESERRDNENATVLDATSKKRQTLQETLSAMPKLNNPQSMFDEALEKTWNKCEYQLPFENMPSRWNTITRSLQMTTKYEILLNGEIRISAKENEELHAISPGGNFNTVVVGLDINNRPLAVKRVSKDDTVCKAIKNMVNPLLGLRNVNLLHYYICNYEANELILATPLCEYNMGEYIMLMKQSSNMCNKFVDMVKQFLAGLRFLHNRIEPIVHGNLKPSNIFIDLNGTVRIAEFGMHKILYILTEAPNTSVIWFSRETFTKFKDTKTIYCTCASDIQVAGMLVHFVLTAGKHPYGSTMQEILKHLERALPQLTTNNIDLHDLISWMLLYDPLERPTINQVLSHVFFWTIDRKWRFILACSGISPYGTPLNISITELHSYINVKATKEKIKGSWINITKMRFSNLTYSKDDQDTIIGFLKFIRNYIQNQAVLHLNMDYEFRNFILSSFPALPLSLYRILETSQWLNHRILQPFTTVDSLSA